MNERPETIVAAGVGNTSVQFGRFAARRPAPDVGLPAPARHHIFPVIDGAPQFTPTSDDGFKRWIIASVNQSAAAKLEAWAREAFDANHFHLLKHDEFPIKLAVDHPDKVGADRIASAVAVNRLRNADRAAIFIDAGTALTVNLVSARGEFCGGAILPGAGTSLDVLQRTTQQLPQVDLERLSAEDPPSALGKDTTAAIRSGVYWGLVGAVRELVGRIADGEDPELFITGGFGAALAAELGDSFRYIPHLVIAGVALTAWQLP